MDEIDSYKEDVRRLKDELFEQELRLRAQIVESYDALMKRRDEDFKRKIETQKQTMARQAEAEVGLLFVYVNELHFNGFYYHSRFNL